jgi:hypothetical protein
MELFLLAQVEVPNVPVTPLRLLASKSWLSLLALLLVTPRNITCGWYITKTNNSGVDIQLAFYLLFPTLLYNQDSPKRPKMRWICRSCLNTYGWALHIRPAHANSCYRCGTLRGMNRNNTTQIGVIYHMICIRNSCRTVNAIENQNCQNGPGFGCGREFPIKNDPQTEELPGNVILVIDPYKPFRKWFFMRCGAYVEARRGYCWREGCLRSRGTGAPMWNEDEKE